MGLITNTPVSPTNHSLICIVSRCLEEWPATRMIISAWKKLLSFAIVTPWARLTSTTEEYSMNA